MDIAKYAGLFFLRNEFLYLPSIGNLEVKKSASSYSTEYGSLNSGNKEILFRAGTGVIEDSFSNFVANNERISIAAATNHIRDFGASAKRSLSQNEKVEIPGVGHFVNKNGNITFESLGNIEYNPKPVKVFTNAQVLEDRKEKNIKDIYNETHFATPTADDEIILEKPRVNYGKIAILVTLGILALGVLGYLGYYFVNQKMNESSNSTPDNSVVEAPIPDVAIDTVATIADTNKVDTTADSTMTNSAVTATNGAAYQIVVNQYPTAAAAEKRVSKLKTYGYIPSVVSKDSATHMVIVAIPTANGAEATVVDSIRRLLNPSFDVRVLR